jgi:hypothetical protein
MSDNLVDPLLALLRRHEEANAAFDTAAVRDASEAEKDHLFEACKRTMYAIVDRAPATTTAEGVQLRSITFSVTMPCRIVRGPPARCSFVTLLRRRATTSFARPRHSQSGAAAADGSNAWLFQYS